MVAAVCAMVWLSAQAWAAACADCHPRQAGNLGAMGRSFREVAATMDRAAFRHDASRSRIEVKGNVHAVNGQARQVRYAVGSGKAGESFLVERDGALFQSPVSRYAGKGWAVSPGYENDRRLTFSRPVTEECVFCHAGAASFVAGSLNRYENPPAPVNGIPCERCHGPGAAHQAEPKAANVVNPAKLAGALRDSICEQCHLSGEARVLNDRKRWQDFMPGGPLEETFTVYVRGAANSALQVVSHVEQLAASRCAQQSGGRLWCGSCHQVHGGAADQRQICLNCHTPLPRHAGKTQDCAGCHMTKRKTADGGHTAFTDHRITRRPLGAGGAMQAPSELRPWRPSAGDARNLGLAYVAVSDKWSSNELLQQGWKHLSAAPKDAEVYGAIGYLLMRGQKPQEAIRWLAGAVERAPRNVRLRLNLALAMASAGRTDAARRALEELLELDATLEAARAALVQLPAAR